MHPEPSKPLDAFPRDFCRKAQIALKLGSLVDMGAENGRKNRYRTLERLSALYQLPGIQASRPPEAAGGCFEIKNSNMTHLEMIQGTAVQRFVA